MLLPLTPDPQGPHLTPTTAIDYIRRSGSASEVRRWGDHLKECEECLLLVAQVRRATRRASPEEIRRVVAKLRARLQEG